MLHRSTLALAALLGIGTLTTSAQTLNTAKLDSLLNSLAANNKLMGSLALAHEGKVVYSHAFGAARVTGTTQTPATAATRYRIGSITKVFTGVLIFQLIEEKKLTLDTKLATFFPQIPNAATITIDQLLSHHSGIHNFTNDPAFGGYMTQPKTQAEMLAIMAQPAPDFAPGTKGAYSNSNFVLLGYIVEKLTKMPYAQALQKRIVARAGLKATYYGGKIAAQKQEAHSYKPTPTGWQPDAESDMSIPGGAGAIVATPTDLTRFMEALFGGKLLAASSLAAMQEVRDGYGRALFVAPFNEKTMYWHNGGIDSFRATANYLPADKLAVALCSNGGTYPINDVAAAALTIYFNKPYQLPNFAATGYVPAPADLYRYAGTYASPQLPLKITMTRAGNSLQSQAAGQSAFPLEPVGAGVFKFEQAGIVVEFAADKPTFTLKQGGGSYVFTKE
ncbi:serine hydrolase domain-containing protein [Hymenobacter sp. H14-R3]|uniref:serine hydrolase domain-containing protein n=1 Tax=Hymenobacter sp. H14-R3 TaxID=3046308 RepID=UPI0024B96DF9|nr:serine hydrolase domain-containing protein [Hymenobacter sp. H14-R3]MDJ0365562.1 serine hydrolase domain-containing protein [Hymenobacter sp. H14-R3]